MTTFEVHTYVVTPDETRETAWYAEGDRAIDVLKSEAGEYTGEAFYSNAKRHGGIAFVDQAHSQADPRRGTVGAYAIRVGFDCHVPAGAAK